MILTLTKNMTALLILSFPLDLKNFPNTGILPNSGTLSSIAVFLDLDFKLHDNLISNFEKHLTDNGRIVFLEDLNFISRDFMESKIDENKSGKYKEFCVGREYIGKDGKRKQRPENTIYEEPNTPNYYTLTYYKQTTWRKLVME